MNVVILDELGLELDKESWEWLCDNHPTVADAVQGAVQKKGATPDTIRSFVLRRCGANRVDFARRCEGASRYLLAISS